MAAESPICMRCGLIFKSRQGEDHLCGECLQSEKPYGKARAAGVHDQALMSIMHAYKYGGKVQLAGPLSKLLTAVFERHWQPDAIDLVLPIPLHPTRLRERGFNQAYLLVRSWGDIVARDILQRKRPTSPQTGLGRKERLRNVRGAFAVKDPLAVKNRRILLVDDVYTTGATVKECARILKKCNAVQVDILTVGRAIDMRSQDPMSSEFRTSVNYGGRSAVLSVCQYGSSARACARYFHTPGRKEPATL